MKARPLDLTTPDGVADAWLHLPDGEGPFPAVLLFTDAFGLRPVVRQMSERLVAQGYAVLAPNLLYRAGDFAPFDPKTVWTVPDERSRLMGYIHQVTNAAAMRDVGAWLDALAGQPAIAKGPVGAVGYCMGGRIAFAAAGVYPERFAAVASIHGGHLVSTEKDSPHLAAGQVRARLYFGVADHDRSCTPDDQQTLAAALDAAKVRYRLELNPGAAHGYAMADTPAYDAKASEQHWERVLALFAEALPARSP